MEHISKKELDLILKDLQSKKIKYTYSITGSTTTLKSKFGDFYYGRSGIPFEELHFIQKVKKHILGRDLSHLKNYTKKDIDYYSYSKLKKGTIRDAHEVDINAAYWRGARKLKIISESLYQEGLEVGKITRLASLGALAKNPTVIKFDGVKERFMPDIPAETSYVWYNICRDISCTMIAAKESIKNDFIFMWVDALILKNKENISLVQDVFYNSGYDSKIKNIHKLVVKDNKINIYDNEKDFRPFPIVRN